jgi:methylmalonyl-CoA/ethylmalonyl-CoA epimerase
MTVKGSMAGKWKYDHIGAVVRDAEAAGGYFESLDIVGKVSELITMEGKKVKVVGKFNQIGDLTIEYWQPVRGESVQQEFLDSRGEGVNHVDLAIDDYEKVYARWHDEKGIRLVFGSRPPIPPAGGGGYFDTRRGQNLLLEVKQRAPGPEPRNWIPDEELAGRCISGKWRFHHIGAVVRDLDKADEYFRSLGVVNKVSGPIMVEDKEARLVGKFIQIGDINLEYWQPVRGESVQQEFLDSAGEGVDHVGFIVDNYDEAYDKLVVEKGIRLVSGSRPPTPPTGGGGYFDTRQGHNILLELMQPPPGHRLIEWSP